jgi:hypothetical protein
MSENIDQTALNATNTEEDLLILFQQRVTDLEQSWVKLLRASQKIENMFGFYVLVDWWIGLEIVREAQNTLSTQLNGVKSDLNTSRSATLEAGLREANRLHGLALGYLCA